MRAPFQEGDFDGPVKYGYLSVGVVEGLGPGTADPGLLGRRVFCHYPHQDRYVVPVESLTPIPDAVPSPRAVLAGTVETAINALWDARPLYAERVAVIGVGLVGASVLSLLQRFPLARLLGVDPDPQAHLVARTWGADCVHPDELSGEFDLVVHCSGTGDGLAAGLEVLDYEGRAVELSWFGRHQPRIPLGAQFHARRLSLHASQVSAVAPSMRARRQRSDRLTLALGALADPRYDRLLTGPSPFETLPQTMGRLATAHESVWCHVVDYPDPADAAEQES